MFAGGSGGEPAGVAQVLKEYRPGKGSCWLGCRAGVRDS